MGREKYDRKNRFHDLTGKMGENLTPQRNPQQCCSAIPYNANHNRNNDFNTCRLNAPFCPACADPNGAYANHGSLLLWENECWSCY